MPQCTLFQKAFGRYANASEKSGHGIYVAHQAAFQVGSLVAMDIATLRQTVNHADDLRQKFSSSCFIFQLAQVFDSRAGRFFVITILQTALLCLANAL